eukprot:15475275-Alexandrium_andersonii.AAC.1
MAYGALQGPGTQYTGLRTSYGNPRTAYGRPVRRRGLKLGAPRDRLNCNSIKLWWLGAFLRGCQWIGS